MPHIYAPVDGKLETAGNRVREVFTNAIFGKDSCRVMYTTHSLSSSHLLHRHEFFEMVYVTEGSAIHMINGEASTIEAGDYFIIDRNVFHTYIGNLTIINCAFRPELLDPVLHGVEQFESILTSRIFSAGTVAKGIRITEVVFHDTSGCIGETFREMEAEYSARQNGYQEIIRADCLRIFIYALRNLDKREYLPINGIIQRLIQYVQNNIVGTISLSDFCKAEYYSIPYVSRLFHKEIGISFSQYVQELKMENFCRFLVETDMKIVEIRRMFGYKDAKYFYSLFQKSTGMAPQQYRELYQKNCKTP